MSKRQKQYHATIDRNGTEDEITIRSPKGRSMAFIWFWDDHQFGTTKLSRAKEDAMEIVNGLNLSRSLRKTALGGYQHDAESVVETLPRLYAALEKCEAALGDIFARYQELGVRESESEKQAKAEAYKTLCLARGEIPF